MTRFILIVSTIVVSTAAIAADDNAQALALLRGVVQERLKHDSFHIRYEEHWPKTGITLERVIDFDKGKIRIEHFPGAGSLGRQGILLEEIVYYVRTHDDNRIAIMSRQAPETRGIGFFDPRLLGLSELMDHYVDVRSCLPSETRNDFLVFRESLDGRSVYVVEYRDGQENGFAHFRLYIEEPGFRMIRQTIESQKHRIRIDNDYSEKKFLPFPTTIHISRVGTNGELVTDRYITVKDVQIQKSFPPETFTLAGLNPPLNADVVDYRTSRRLGYWDGEKIVDNPVRISAQESRARIVRKK